MISDEDVSKIAQLAHLELNKDEVHSLTGELNSILGYVQQLEKTDVNHVTPMSHVHGINNIMRDDTVSEHLDSDEALKNAPDTSGRFIRVPIIIDQGTEN